MHNPIFKDVRLAFNSGEGHLKKHKSTLSTLRGGSPDRGGIYRQEEEEFLCVLLFSDSFFLSAYKYYFRYRLKSKSPSNFPLFSFSAYIAAHSCCLNHLFCFIKAHIQVLYLSCKQVVDRLQ